MPRPPPRTLRRAVSASSSGRREPRGEASEPSTSRSLTSWPACKGRTDEAGGGRVAATAAAAVLEGVRTGGKAVRYRM